MFIKMNRVLALTLVGLAVLGFTTVLKAAPTAPVTFEYNVPSDIESGTEVTSSIRFVAGTDMQNMVVSTSAYSGLSIVSGGEQQVFTGVNKGDTYDIAVRIRLDEELGYLAVFAATTDAQGRVMNRNTAIRYGKPGATTRQRLSSGSLTTGSNGETLILMPAEAD
jgi:hypothetical protein